MEDSKITAARRFRSSAVVLLVLFAATCWAGERNFKFNIPAEALPQALRTFYLQSGVRVVFTPHRLWATVRTHAVVGEYTPIQALDRMLDGTALVFGYDTESSIFMEETAYVDPDTSLVHQTADGSVPPLRY